MKQFHNEDMMAPNVLRVAIDASAGGEILKMLGSGFGQRDLATMSPPWNSDMKWISAGSHKAFAVFQREFDRLNIAAHVEPYVDLDEEVRLYSGFLVQRSICRRPDFHVDWIDTNNEAFTLLTPLTDNAAGFGLLYEKDDGSLGEYDYKVGEALIIGDNFLHSTKPGRTAEPVVLLSFTFGTDKMEHWERIAPTAAAQGPLICRPDGTFQDKTSSRSLVARAKRVLRRLA